MQACIHIDPRSGCNYVAIPYRLKCSLALPVTTLLYMCVYLFSARAMLTFSRHRAVWCAHLRCCKIGQRFIVQQHMAASASSASSAAFLAFWQLARLRRWRGSRRWVAEDVRTGGVGQGLLSVGDDCSCRLWEVHKWEELSGRLCLARPNPSGTHTQQTSGSSGCKQHVQNK